MAFQDVLNSMQQQPLPSMDGITNALAQNAMIPAPQAAPQPAPQAQPYRPHGIGNFLGGLGDALLQANGIAPIHQAYVERRQTQEALQNFLTDPQGAIAKLMQVDAPTGIALWKAIHPPSEVPDTAKVYEYRQRLSPDQQVQFDKVNQLLHPGMMAPVTLGPTDTVEGGTGEPAAGMPYAATPEDAKKYPPGTLVNTPYGVKRVPGGATASTPSPTFSR